MTVAELIEKLSNLPAQAPVKAWDYYTEEYEDVIGIVWGVGGSELLVQTREK